MIFYANTVDKWERYTQWLAPESPWTITTMCRLPIVPVSCLTFYVVRCFWLVRIISPTGKLFLVSNIIFAEVALQSYQYIKSSACFYTTWKLFQVSTTKFLRSKRVPNLSHKWHLQSTCLDSQRYQVPFVEVLQPSFSMFKNWYPKCSKRKWLRKNTLVCNSRGKILV